MTGFYNYTDRVTTQEDGSYCWRYETDREYARRGLKAATIICVGIAVFIVVLGAVISRGEAEVILISAGCAAITLAICFLVCFVVDRMPGIRREIYHLTDTFIQTGYGKSSEVFSFKSARSVIVTARYIELKGRFAGPRIYVPEEDMYFVRSYIMRRIPGEAEVSYQ